MDTISVNRRDRMKTRKNTRQIFSPHFKTTSVCADFTANLLKKSSALATKPAEDGSAEPHAAGLWPKPPSSRSSSRREGCWGAVVVLPGPRQPLPAPPPARPPGPTLGIRMCSMAAAPSRAPHPPSAAGGEAAARTRPLSSFLLSALL